jgi:hypothetical protein
MAAETSELEREIKGLLGSGAEAAPLSALPRDIVQEEDGGALNTIAPPYNPAWANARAGPS